MRSIGCNDNSSDLRLLGNKATFTENRLRSMQPIALTLGQKFEIEKFSRDIDNSNDVQQLRELAKDLLVAWKQQQSAAAWIMRDMQSLRDQE